MDSAELSQIGKKQNNVFTQLDIHFCLPVTLTLQFLFFGAILIGKRTFDVPRMSRLLKG